MENSCFEPGCMLNVEYSCPCSSPPVYTCKLHALNHMETPNKDHALKQIFVESYEKTREAILKFLSKCEAKHKNIKEKVLASFSQRFYDTENDLEGLIKEIDSYSAELNNCFIKISEAKRIKKSEQDSVLALLSLQPDEAIEKIKKIIPPNLNWYKNSKVFFGFNEKIEKMIECFIENKFHNYLENRLTKIENTLTEHNKSINLTNNELEDVKNSILNVINENNKSLRDFEEWKEKTKLKTENEISLLSSQISSMIDDFNYKFKEVEETQRNFRNIMIKQDLETKRSEILKSSNNNSELEKEVRRVCSDYENNFSTPEDSVTQAYLDIVNTYQQKSSLFNFVQKENQTNLLIFNTEAETQESKILETPQPLGKGTCITQLPNGKLFCFGNYPTSGITLLIDENYRVKELPSGTICGWSSAIYFNNNIYCFGGVCNTKRARISSRFDLDRNQWNGLTPMPNTDSSCNSIIFNGSILISGKINKNLLRYSIDSNSFSTIPYDFAKRNRKILINAERIYLIECKNGSIYESEIASDTNWRQITNNTAINFRPDQTYCHYNKQEIYIGCNHLEEFCCFKFSLNEKRLIKLI